MSNANSNKYTVCITRRGQKSDSSCRGVGGGVVVRISLVLCLLRAPCTYILQNVGTLDVLYTPTINGGTGITGRQQTNRNSLMIIFYT